MPHDVHVVDAQVHHHADSLILDGNDDTLRDASEMTLPILPLSIVSLATETIGVAAFYEPGGDGDAGLLRRPAQLLPPSWNRR